MLSRNSGDIINISSDSGRKIFPGGAIYCASKHAVEAITQTLRIETEGTNLKIVSIQPGACYSELTNSITDEDAKKLGAAFAKMRLLDAEDVANSVVFALTQPPHCSINEILLRPTQQRQ